MSVDDSDFIEDKTRLLSLVFKAATQNNIIFNLLLKNNDGHRRRFCQEKSVQIFVFLLLREGL